MWHTHARALTSVKSSMYSPSSLSIDRVKLWKWKEKIRDKISVGRSSKVTEDLVLGSSVDMVVYSR